MLDELADAITDELNMGDFNQEFTAQRLYVPDFKLSEMDTLHVSVVGRSINAEALTRATTKFECAVDIAIQQKIDPTNTESDCDALMALVREIAAYFRRKRLTNYGTAIWIKEENDPVYLPEHIKEMHQFTSVLRLTYVVVE